ncbi:MAG: hypothetical protein HY819_19395 [Acidobacteria bacterium]|nr:hypothetical protein [Acidobacteriota bacterium]
MKTFLSFFLFLMTILSLNYEVFAQSGSYQHGNVIYKIPSGYRQQASDSLMVLLPKEQNFENAEIVFLITPGVDNPPNDLSNFLNTLVNKAESEREIINRQFSEDSFDGNKIISEISISKDNQGTYFTMYIMVGVGRRAEFFTVVATNSDAFEKYSSQLKEFFSNLSFANSKNSNSNSLTQNNNRSSNNNSKPRNNSSASQQAQRNRTYANQVFLNSITNNYNSLSNGIR